MEPVKISDEELLFEHMVKSLESQITNVGAHLTIDTRARLLYIKEIKRMSDRLRASAIAGRMTWAASAREAQETCNLIMGIMGARSTPVGRSFAESLKLKGRSLNQMVAAKTIELHGENAIFSRLSNTKQNSVYASIVTSAGKPNWLMTRTMANLGAIAGLACGPAAPVCVTVGAFAGGALAAFGASYSW
ncbi:hypothetical protein GTP45_15885 [Pseudoduganella sp. FT55W]|uniref:Uncharacterized protein n=1 Tax=Duganella rivi TaxID=2666083 RepID=A0A7X4GRM9_9BURK|nr:hypothetical protein [Duganella rivi]MYM68298.1 hypothetical protein [Duganella rivi]